MKRPNKPAGSLALLVWLMIGLFVTINPPPTFAEEVSEPTQVEALGKAPEEKKLEEKKEAESKADEQKLDEEKKAKMESAEETRLSLLNQAPQYRMKGAAGRDYKAETPIASAVVDVKISKKGEVEENSAKGVCGVLVDFMGKVEILDATRSKILDSNMNTNFNCGSWISVRSGWALMKFVSGQKVRLGHDTLVQVQGNNDQILLYRGLAYVESSPGGGEFRLANAVGRARIANGKIIFLYSPESDATQIIALDHSATLENRFEPSRRLEVQSGETSELNFKQLRVIPLLPSPVAGAALKAVLDQLDVPETEKAQAIKIALARHERKFALLRKEDVPDRSEESQIEETSAPGRGLASMVAAKKKAREKLTLANQPYLRHAPDPEYPKLEEQLVSRIAGGAPEAKKLVNPGSPKVPQEQQSGRNLASESSESEQISNQRLLPAEEAAKKKLIHALSEIKIE